MLQWEHHEGKYSQNSPIMGRLESRFFMYIKPRAIKFVRGFLCFVGFLSHFSLLPCLTKGRAICFIILSHGYTSCLLRRRSLWVGQCGTDIVSKGYNTGMPSGFYYLELMFSSLFTGFYCVRSSSIIPSYKAFFV